MTPNVTLLSTPMKNDWGYTGPAALNPFFHPTGTAPDYTFVPDFMGWFDAVAVYDVTTGNVNHYVSPKQTASEAGAQEALRLVTMFVPGAVLEAVRGVEGGRYFADKMTYSVVLPDGRRFNAAGIVDRYYHGGAGVSAASDLDLMAELGVALPAPTPAPAPEIPVAPEPTKPAPMPDGPGVLGAATFSGGVFLHGPGSEAYDLGAIITINGKKYKKLPATWNEVK